MFSITLKPTQQLTTYVFRHLFLNGEGNAIYDMGIIQTGLYDSMCTQYRASMVYVTSTFIHIHNTNPCNIQHQRAQK